MGNLTIDYQDVYETCAHCSEIYTVSRGSAYDDGEGAAIYLAALHDCGASRVAHVAIAVRAGYEDFAETSGAFFRIYERFGLEGVDPESSPWNGLDYLGRILTSAEVLESPLKVRRTFHDVADRIYEDNPTIWRYLAGISM